MKVGRKCFGVTLWAWRGRRVELWMCGEGVPAHRHPGQKVEVLPLFGWALFWRNAPVGGGGRPGEMASVAIRPGVWGRRWLTIPAGWWHWFELRRGPLVFVNVTEGKSPADNFEASGAVAKP